MMKMTHFIKTHLLSTLLLMPLLTMAQGYQALHGSPYSGSTAVFNNPAASIGSAYKWDLTLLSTQFKLSTNGSYLQDFSLSNQANTTLGLRNGYGSRFVHTNMDLSFLNFLYKIDNRKAVNLSFRARTYNHAKSLPFNYVDSTINSFNSFLVTNRNTAFLEGFVTHSGWLEAGLNYSQVLSETDNTRLTGGITLQIMKGISGAFMKISKVSFLEQKNSTDTAYLFTNGRGSFAYSDNYDGTDGFKDFVNRAKTGLGLSLGIEYLVYDAANNESGSMNNLNYDWKIGVSVMDIGAQSFRASQYSRQFADPNTNISDASVDNKLTGAANIRDFGDSLATLFNGNSVITDNFSVSNPTRLIVNVDKNLGNHFYVNGELSMNFFATSSYNKLNTRELNLLTITPRWETIGLGAYLPVQYNTQGQFWIGAAVKLGPLVLGLHNLGLLKKDPGLNGGGYLLVSIHPFSKRKMISKLDCL